MQKNKLIKCLVYFKPPGQKKKTPMIQQQQRNKEIQEVWLQKKWLSEWQLNVNLLSGPFFVNYNL